MDIENLLKELKRAERYCLNDYSRMAGQAATALSTLQAENKRLNKIVCSIPTTPDSGRTVSQYDKEMSMCAYLDDLEAENTQLKEKLEALKQDRDAIEQDFRAFAKQWWEQDSGFPCCWCKFEKSGGCEWKVKHPGEICEGRAFEWRGQKEE